MLQLARPTEVASEPRSLWGGVSEGVSRKAGILGICDIFAAFTGYRSKSCSRYADYSDYDGRTSVVCGPGRFGRLQAA
jgi:hypothetical protein